MADSYSLWGCDGAVSMPQPLPPDPGQAVDLGGFAFITMGLTHLLTQVDREELLSRGWGPVAGDGDG